LVRISAKKSNNVNTKMSGSMHTPQTNNIAPPITTPTATAPRTPLSLPTAAPVFDGVAGAVDVADPGTVSFSAVRFTGAGAFAAVRLVSRPGPMNTGPPPAPTADVLGAVYGTYMLRLRGPGVVPEALVSGMEEPEMAWLV
jgi:hypothetical protein